MGKKALIGFGVLLALAVGYLYAAQGSKQPAPAPKPSTKIPSSSAPAADKPTYRWEQDISSTFRYAGQVLSVNKVIADRLNRKTARVRYKLTITPNPNRPDRWVAQKARYNLLIPGRHKPARKVTVKKVGGKRYVTVEFRWPTPLLTDGSQFQVQLPTRKGKPEVVGLALEVPKSLQGIEERTGAGGLG